MEQRFAEMLPYDMAFKLAAFELQEPDCEPEIVRPIHDRFKECLNIPVRDIWGMRLNRDGRKNVALQNALLKVVFKKLRNFEKPYLALFDDKCLYTWLLAMHHWYDYLLTRRLFLFDPEFLEQWEAFLAYYARCERNFDSLTKDEHVGEARALSEKFMAMLDDAGFYAAPVY